LRWLALFAEELGIDASRIALWGESAGAHLAGLVATTSQDPEWEGTLGPAGVAPEVSALVNWFGAMDLTTIVRPMDGSDATLPDLARFPPEWFNLGADRWQDQALRKMASPITHVTASTPPTILLHGEADEMVPIQQSEVMFSALQDAGVEAVFHRVPEAGHVWFTRPPEVVDEVIDMSLSFIADHLHERTSSEA
jgi:acetyl esterase/lipase